MSVRHGPDHGVSADEIGRGPLARGAALVYRMLVLEAQLLLAASPTVVAILLLDRDPSNLPLFVLALLPLLTFNLVHLDAVDGGAAMRPATLMLAGLLVAWSGHMVVLTAGFRFRTRDAARIALAGLLPRWSFTLGVVALTVVAAFVVVAASEVLFLLLLWAFVGLFALMARPVFDDSRARFTVPD
ncbi:hypothetical protein ACFQS3_10105 [Glycomyces mayteni]|uniref:Uncharacterized protein n=1 Tax=Glycomyces mayteni TaxID=543887 RepID=A0ABW2D7R8_9ACTN